MNCLKRIIKYYKDKKLADKCGLKVKDICVHEPTDESLILGKTYKDLSGEPFQITHHSCKKCGEFYN